MPKRAPTNRHTRRREETRDRIVAAAENLMREQGVDAITVQDITERADVGHGSFYIHFESKNDVLVPIARDHALRFSLQLDDLTGKYEDPAAAFATNVRHLFRAIAGDPLWSYFIFRSGLPNEKLREGIGDAGRRDLERGYTSGRFLFPHVDTVVSFLLGALVGVLDDVSRGILDERAFDTAAELVLRVVGVSIDEAAEICGRPLPPMENGNRKSAKSEST
jgi:AcrR family transcriptional regulator